MVAVTGEDGTVVLDREELPRPDTTPGEARRAQALLRPTGRHAVRRLTTAPSTRCAQQVYPRGHGRQPRSSRRQLLRARRRRRGGSARAPRKTPGRAAWRPRARVVIRGQRGRRAGDHADRPGPATAACLEKAGMSLSDIDLFEVNEAFASVVAAVHPRDRRRPGDGERQRRSHRPRASDRRQRTDPARDAARRAGAAGPVDRRLSRCAPGAAWAPRPSSSASDAAWLETPQEVANRSRRGPVAGIDRT